MNELNHTDDATPSDCSRTENDQNWGIDGERCWLVVLVTLGCAFVVTQRGRRKGVVRRGQRLGPAGESRLCVDSLRKGWWGAHCIG